MHEELDIKSVKIATRVIIHAGNARALINESITAAARGDFAAAERKLERAGQEISSAHTTQTDVIHAEARGDRLQLSLLLTHAQDSLMAVMSEVMMAEHIHGLYKRINSLEARLALRTE